MRWQLANGRIQEVVEQLKRAAKMNKRSVQDVLDTFHSHLGAARARTVNATSGDVSAQTDDVANKDGGPHAAAATDSSFLALEEEREEGKVEKLSFLDLFRHRRLRTNTLCLWAIW